jgi:hypothetical protein
MPTGRARLGFQHQRTKFAKFSRDNTTAHRSPRTRCARLKSLFAPHNPFHSSGTFLPVDTALSERILPCLFLSRATFRNIGSTWLHTTGALTALLTCAPALRREADDRLPLDCPLLKITTINITNQPCALIDIVKLNDMASAISTLSRQLPLALCLLRRPSLFRSPPGPNSRQNDLRRTLLKRTATAKGHPAPDAQSPTASSSAAHPAPRPPGDTKSAKRRKRNARVTENKVTQALVST